MTGDWMRSSALTVFLDFILLEAIAIVLFALLGILWVYWKQNRCLLMTIVALEVYRFYRNFVEG